MWNWKIRDKGVGETSLFAFHTVFVCRPHGSYLYYTVIISCSFPTWPFSACVNAFWAPHAWLTPIVQQMNCKLVLRNSDLALTCTPYLSHLPASLCQPVSHGVAEFTTIHGFPGPLHLRERLSLGQTKA